MAIDEGKPVYLFDQLDNCWKTFNKEGRRWEDVLHSTLRIDQRKNFAGIGSRELTEEGKKAIQDLMERSFERID
jgi:hypothetical protein